MRSEERGRERLVEPGEWGEGRGTRSEERGTRDEGDGCWWRLVRGMRGEMGLLGVMG